MFSKDEIKTYNENIKREQIKLKCAKCGFTTWAFPEHKDNSICLCGKRLTAKSNN